MSRLITKRKGAKIILNTKISRNKQNFVSFLHSVFVENLCAFASLRFELNQES